MDDCRNVGTMTKITPHSILESVALELRSVSERIKSVESATSELTNSLPRRTKPSTSQALQNLDVADQIILALASYLSDVSKTMPYFPAIDVSKPISRVPLEALEDRLSGRSLNIADTGRGQTGGIPEIF